MDDNFIKDDRVFPQEMYAINSEAKQFDTKSQEKKKPGVIAWIIILILLLGLAFLLVKLMNNKKPEQGISADEVIVQKQREEKISTITRTNQEMTPQERAERLNRFFGNQ